MTLTAESFDLTGKAPKPARGGAVARNSEFERVRDQPRRAWSDASPETQALVRDMTAWLRRPGGTRTLLPQQAVALAELYTRRGLFGILPAGFGKTDISFLASVVLDAKRPVLVIPAKLRDDKTPRDFAILAAQYRSPATLRIISYQELSRDYASYVDPVTGEKLGLLEIANPDLIIADEVHALKNHKAACTRKMARFMRRHPDVPFVALSGTITNRSLNDYAHILVWCLKQAAPIPRMFDTLTEWCNALDVKVDEADRMGAGALLDFATDEERATLDELAAARRGFHRRLTDTPGVVAYAEEYTGASLEITAVEPVYGPSTETAFETLRTKWELPDETSVAPESKSIMDGMRVWAAGRQMALGFYYTFDPPPPLPWKNARKAWHRAVREILAHNQRGLDSEGQIALACTQHEFPGAQWAATREAYKAWTAIRDTFKPNTVARWIDDGPLAYVVGWMQHHRGLVWTEHREFAFRLAQVTGAQYYGEEGRNAQGQPIEDAKPSGGSIIASIEANHEGRNLQLWHENLITSLPTTGKKMEQLMARTHRPGQEADEVTVDVMIGCREQGAAWLQVLQDSNWTSSLLPARVFYATKTGLPDAAELLARASGSFRWR